MTSNTEQKRDLCLVALVSFLVFTPNVSQADETRVVGGSGGQAFSLSCGTDAILTGMAGSAGSWFDRLRGLCRKHQGSNLTEQFTRGSAGGTGGNSFSRACAAGKAVTAFRGRAGSYIDHLELGCSDFPGGGNRSWLSNPSVGTGGSSFGTVECPSGQVATAMRGYSGDYINRVGLICKKIVVEPSITGEPLPSAARAVLREILITAGEQAARVTSTTRTAAEQAQAIYNYIKRHGLREAYNLYGSSGDKIIKAYEDAGPKPKDEILEAMLQETRQQLRILEAQGDRRTELMHTSDTHYVFDVAPSSITNKHSFEKAVETHSKVSRFFKPPRDRAYHIEIPK